MVADFMTLKELCDLLKIGERNAYGLARRGKIPGGAKVGNQWRFNRAKILAWLEAGGDWQREAEAGSEE